MTSAEMLAEVRNVLLRKGWAQGLAAYERGVYGKPGPTCLVGALDFASRVHGGPWGEVYGLLTQAVGGVVAEWNDAPGRTFGEVLAAIDRAQKLVVVA